MRKFLQKQWFELIETMKTAAGMLEKIYSDQDVATFGEILAGLQEAAISIGDKLDEFLEKDDGTINEDAAVVMQETIGLLESYCELVWNISNIEGQVQLQEALVTLQETLVQIEAKIQQMPVRLEVAFLPYKASMWDCMETVWVAAKEDSECDVYVVPIPYYDLRPDGSMGQMHYEADLMPKNVPVTDFRNYNIEERRPDIIYIHNPFDDYNRVTRVHSDYYSSKLRNYTDMLVYIPYFLMGEHLSESHGLLPAYVYADKIVLNAESMMEDIDPSISRDKFIIAGSPKAERLIRMAQHKDELEVPYDWKRKMDGKKVVFYNLSISGLLKYKEKMIAKMDEVFGIFKKREDVVLLYRPHPLIESTLTSMCPELVSDYQALVKRVKKMKNAIYDTTPDASVAVALCDAYVGEGTSSIVEMFKVLQKPVFYLTEKMYYQPTLDEMLSDKTLDVCKVGDDLWFITRKSQLLCKYNMKTEVMECVAEIPDAVKVAEYTKLVNYENKLILVPSTANAVCVYNMETGVFRKDYFRDENVLSKFNAGAIVYEHYIFLVPTLYPAIMRYDILTGEFVYYRDCVKEAYSRMKHEEERAPFTAFSVWEDVIYILSGRANDVLCFNMRTEKGTVHSLDKALTRFACIAVDKNYCWIGKYKDCTIFRWNRDTDEIMEYSNVPEEFEYGNFAYSSILAMEEKIYLLAMKSNKLLQMSKTTDKIVFSDIKLPYRDGTFKSEYYRFGEYDYIFSKRLSDNEIVACSNYDDSLMIFNVDDKSCKKIPIRIGSQLQTEAKKYAGSLKIRSENINMPLSKYVEYVVRELLEENILIGSVKNGLGLDVPPGKIIHEQVRKFLVNVIL